MPNYIQNPIGIEHAVIASAGSLSSGVNLGGLRLFGVLVPSSWTAASMTFQTSHDGGVSWYDLYTSEGEEVSIMAGADNYVAVDPLLFAAVPMIKVRSGSSLSPINQDAESSIDLVSRAV